MFLTACKLGTSDGGIRIAWAVHLYVTINFASSDWTKMVLLKIKMPLAFMHKLQLVMYCTSLPILLPYATVVTLVEWMCSAFF